MTKQTNELRVLKLEVEKELLIVACLDKSVTELVSNTKEAVLYLKKRIKHLDKMEQNYLLMQLAQQDKGHQ